MIWDTVPLPNLGRFYSILAAIQYFKLWKSATMDLFVTFVNWPIDKNLINPRNIAEMLVYNGAFPKN